MSDTLKSSKPYDGLALDDQCSRFRAMANEISLLAASVNIRVVPYYDETLAHFSKLDHSSRQNILASLEIYFKVYQAVQAEGSSLLDSIRVVWNALSQLGYRPTSDLFTYVNCGAVIEIHDNTLVQVFRNLIFFNFCSYSLEELYCHKMPNLYTRDIAFEQQLMGYVHQIYNGDAREIIKPQLKPHTITELASKERLKITDDIHYIAPLFSATGGSKPVATLTIESARVESRGVGPTISESVKPHVISSVDLLI